MSAAALLMCAAIPGLAQYKVIGADGKTTYTDRPPTTSEGRVTALRARNAPVVNEAALPFELRQVASRYPVTLYVSSGACEPCGQVSRSCGTSSRPSHSPRPRRRPNCG